MNSTHYIKGFIIVAFTIAAPLLVLFILWFWDRQPSIVEGSFRWIEIEWIEEIESLHVSVTYLIDKDCTQIQITQISGPDFIRTLGPSHRYPSVRSAINPTVNPATGVLEPKLFEDLQQIPGLQPGDYKVTPIIREWCNPVHNYFNMPIEAALPSGGFTVP